MTEKLYYRDSHLMECEAKVLRAERTDRGWDVVLDRTVLFENAGGQPADTGHIGGVRVLGSDERGGELIVHTNGELEVGKTYTVRVDAERRLDLMRQHTGEHLLSYAFYRLYGINNVGFHLADDHATIDLDASLSEDMITEALRLANSFVTADLPVTATVYETKEAFDAAGLSLRKQSEKAVPPIRIVSVEGADTCTCCAPHCSRTGEIGLIFVSDAAPYKGGTRLSFLCGARALSFIWKEHLTLNGIARSFSCARSNVRENIAKKERELSESKKREKELLDIVNRSVAVELSEKILPAGGIPMLCAYLGEGYDPDRLRRIALDTLKAPDALTLLLGIAGEKFCYAVCTGESCPIDAGAAAKTVNRVAGTKGGGRGSLAQGSGPIPESPEAVAEEIRLCLENGEV